MAKKTSRLLLTILIFSFFVLSAVTASAGPDNYIESNPECITDESYDSAYSATTVTGHSMGNHRLDCTVIRPWCVENPPGQYPVIVWANGWGWNNNAGETTTLGYKPGLIEWALSGPYVVVAANAWSAQESDVLRCLQWLVDQNDVQESDYYEKIDTSKIGLAGHSQGGGATIKAGGDGEKVGVSITATIAMNPYGPAWVDPGNQDGPMLILGGKNDSTTPEESYQAVWDAVAANGIGGINATLLKGTHNSEAWGVFPYPDGETLDNEEASEINFVKYQYITELWWDYFLNGNSNSFASLIGILDNEDEWDTEYAYDSFYF